MEFPVQLYRHRPAGEPARGARARPAAGARPLLGRAASRAFCAGESEGNLVLSEETHRCKLARSRIGIGLLGLASSHPSPRNPPFAFQRAAGTVGREKKSRKGRYLCLGLSLTLEGLNVFTYLVTFPTLNAVGIRALGCLCCEKSRWLTMNAYEICIN